MRWVWPFAIALGWFVACGGASSDLNNFKKPDASTDAGTDAPGKVCVPNQSVACVGPGGCAGGQLCNALGTGFGVCDCGNPPDASVDSPSCTPNQSVGCVGPGGCAGGQVCKPDGSGFGPCDCGNPPDGSADGPTCIPNQSVACVGPGGCAGAQVCKNDGSGFGACDCGNPPDASNDAPVCVPNQSIACVGPGGCAGGQVCKSDGSGYETCDCGANDSGADAADASTGPLAPDQISGLSLWLDSMKGTVADLAHPGQIQTWADQSPIGNNAYTPAYQEEPILQTLGYKSFDVVHFPPARRFRINDDTSLQFGTGPFAVVFVLRLLTVDSVILWDKGGGLTITADVNINVVTPSANAHAYLSNPGSFHVISIRGPALEIRIDGVSTKSGTNTTDLNEVGWWTLIGAGTSGYSTSQVDYLQVIAYKATVGDAQIVGLETFLKSKYAL